MFRSALAVSGLLLLASGARAAELRVGISTDNPPWSFTPERLQILEAGGRLPPFPADQVKALTGLDVDVAAALARHMDATLTLVPASWLQIEKELLDGRFDAILSSWTPSRKTAPEILASEPYFNWGLVICVGQAGAAVGSLADLATLAVGHYRDPSVEQTLRSVGARAMKPFDSEFALFRALAQREVDAVVHDSTFARWRVNKDASLRIVGEPLNKLGYHVGVRKSDAALVEKVQAAVRALRASPELAAIRARWEAFGRP
jgi:polar amino acid transport system substrate-binding protein